ncbi:MAG: DUF1552 domain-containing protein [Lentisphaeraceae bacterium]|nr:DUF1552 domain-containing protein [Lentisphaeraceae bacterium]
MNNKFNRRTILQVAGASMALPWLETFAASESANAPKRAAFLYMPNGVNGEMWTPKKKGRNYDLSPTLAPLGKYKDQVSVFSNLQHKGTKESSNSDPHRVGTTNLLSGARARRTTGKDMKCGKSVDQVMAQKWGKDTFLPSIELSTSQPYIGVSNHGYTELYGAFISWANDTTPIPREIYPRQAFDRLFLKRDRKGLSKNAMDLFRDQTKKLQKTVGREDKPRLEEYLTTLHELEQRIKRNSENSKPLPFDVKKNRPPEGKPDTFLKHFDMHLDIIALAFQSNRTQVASLMFGNALIGFDFSPVVDGARGSFHAISHHAGDKKKLDVYHKINRYHVMLYTKLLERLDGMKEGNGSVLDNTLVFLGSSMRDGNAHKPVDLPILLGGGKKVMKLGEHKVSPKGTPLCNLFTTMLTACDIPTRSFGDSTGMFKDMLL